MTALALKRTPNPHPMMKFEIQMQQRDGFWYAEALGIKGEEVTIQSAIDVWLDNLIRGGIRLYLESKMPQAIGTPPQAKRNE